MTPLLAAGSAQVQFLVVQVLAFLLLLGILGKLVVPGLRKMLGDRTKGIEDAFSKMEKETAETAQSMADLKERLARFEEQSKRRSDATAADAERTRQAAMADAARQAEAIVAKARQEIRTEKDKATLELAQEAVELIRGAAEEAAKAAMTDAVHRRRIEDYLGKLDTVKRA
jgi:F-type H+-transporting ATPase subunit b